MKAAVDHGKLLFEFLLDENFETMTDHAHVIEKLNLLQAPWIDETRLEVDRRVSAAILSRLGRFGLEELVERHAKDRRFLVRAFGQLVFFVAKVDKRFDENDEKDDKQDGHDNRDAI